MIDKQRPDWNATIQGMFSRISRHYDLLNTLMSLGRDRHWRKFVLKYAAVPPDGSLLDVGAGTGKIALEAKSTYQDIRVTALDLTPDMMKVGKAQAGGGDILWINGDALELPFRDQSFDAVTSGFLMRNAPDVKKAFQEQFRVVQPGGRVICLDTCPPKYHVMKPLIYLYFKIGITFLGGMVSRQWDAYRYLPESIQAFKTPQELAGVMESAGFANVTYRRFMFDTVAIVIGERPPAA